MIALAIVAVTLLGATIALATWAIILPRVKATARVRQIEIGFGFPADAIAAPARRSPLLDVANRIGGLVADRLGGRYEQRVKRMLVQAGYYGIPVRSVAGVQLFLAMLVGAGVAVLGVGATIPVRILAVAALAAFGWAIPLVLLQSRARTRRDAIERKVPDMIDMLVVTIEAGLGFGASMQAASSRIKGPLGQELRLAMQEQEMGSTLRDSLFHCAERTSSRSLNSFVRAVTQGEALGVSIGVVMRNLAEEMRVRRRQEAEERAQKAPVKMLFPLIFLMFPALMIVILGPAMFEIFEVLGGIGK